MLIVYRQTQILPLDKIHKGSSNQKQQNQKGNEAAYERHQNMIFSHVPPESLGNQDTGMRLTLS
jgi:hypothetical protein